MNFQLKGLCFFAVWVLFCMTQLVSAEVDIDKLLNQGGYQEGAKILGQSDLSELNDEDRAILAFFLWQSGHHFKAREHALASGNHYLANLVKALSYLEGVGVKRDVAESIKRFESLYNNLHAMKSRTAFEDYILAEVAEAVEAPDMMKALERACSKNIAGAFNMKGRLLQAEEKYEESLKAYTVAADMGLATACRNVSFFYYRGLGVEKDMDRSMHYAKKSAELGDIYGMINLAVVLDQKDEKDKAMEWIETAAKSKHWMGLLEKGYGLIHERYGFKKDVEGGFRLVKKAAEMGRTAQAFSNLAHLYISGTGTKQDLEMAGICYLCAYKLGAEEHVRSLYTVYLQMKDRDRATYWLLKDKSRVAGFEVSKEQQQRFDAWDKEFEELDPYTLEL